MTTIYKLLDTTTQVDEKTRQVEVICSTASRDRIGDVVVQEGIDTVAYQKNPVVLWGHDSDKPVARASKISLQNGQLRAVAEFPPAGEDPDADWAYGKIKNRLVNAVSIGFLPKEWEPVDPKSPWDGYKFVESELVEFSFVSVPMNAEALIVGRSLMAKQLRDEALPSQRQQSEQEPQAEEQDGKALLAKLTELHAAVEKAGRVLSQKNADRLVLAHKSVQDCLAEHRAAVAAPDPTEADKGLTTKAGRVLSAKNEERLTTAQKCVKDVLDEHGFDPNAPTPEPDEDDANAQRQAPRPARRTHADIEGRSTATRFPDRIRREVELMKLRAS